MGDIVQRINAEAVTPALAILGPRFDSLAARVLLAAAGLQESRLIHRWQIVDPYRPDLKGPARGLWQFERGGVSAVLGNALTGPHARHLCSVLGIQPQVRPVWSWLSESDVLAAGFARLLVFANPYPLPALGHGNEAWDYYLACWRPGKPIRRTWDGFYGQALGVLA